MEKDRSVRFFKIWLIGLFTVIVGSFMALAFFMKWKSTETIEDVGGIYMTGMNEQIRLHYETTITLRLSQVASIVETTPPGSMEHEELYRELAYSVNARGFAYLALYSAQGDLEMIYGEQLSVLDPEPYLNSMRRGEQKIAVAEDASGNGGGSLSGIYERGAFPGRGGDACAVLYYPQGRKLCTAEGLDGEGELSGLPAAVISGG